MSRNKKHLATSLISLGMMLSGAAIAADNLEKVEVLAEESSLVEGISPDESLSLPASFSNSVQVFTRDKIEKMPVSDVFQVLDMAAGVSVSYHGRRSPNLIGMRAGANLGYIIDGALVPTPSASKILAALPLSTIEKIEIVKDSSAINLGPLAAPIGAMTDNRTEGFIVITTRSALDKKNSLTASVDNQGLRQIGVSHAEQFDDSTGVRATLNHAERKEVDGNNKGYKRDAGYMKASHVADTFWLDFSLFHSKGVTDIQRSKISSPPNLRNQKLSFDPTKVTLASFQGVKAWSDKQATTLRASYVESDADLHVKKYNNAPTTYEPTEEKFYSIDLSHAVELGIHNFRAGISILEWDNPTGMLHWHKKHVKERTHSAYIQDEFSIGSWSFDGGVRVDKRYLDEGWEEINGTKYSVSDRKLDPLFAISAGGLYEFDDTLNATFRLLFTQQEPVNLSSQDGSSLPKEKRMRYEMGLNKTWADYLTTKATVFWEHLSDALYVAGHDSSSADPDDWYNIYSASSRDNKGFELILLGQIQNFSYNFSYSHVKPGDTPGGAVNTPENLVKLNLSYTANNWTADLNSKYVDSYVSGNRLGTGVVGDFITTDVQISKVFNQSKKVSHKVSGYIRNIEDKKFETIFFYPDEGRSFGLTYQLNY